LREETLRQMIISYSLLHEAMNTCARCAGAQLSIESEEEMEELLRARVDDFFEEMHEAEDPSE
jgi:hypothetical protein